MERLAPQTPDASLDDIFAALADPTRRAILTRLSGGAASVNDLAAPFAMSQPAISKHLTVLERAGLIERDVDRQRRPARLKAEPMAAAVAWLEDFRQFWSTSFDQLDTLLAVKPHLVLEVAAALVRPRRVVSVAAGITTAAIEAVVPEATPVIRVMPNTPALVGLGASALAPGAAASDDDLSWAEGLLGSVGTAVVVTEAQLDAVTGLSGSGPAYLFLVAEALADAGVAAGLPRPIAERLANQTVHGAGVMLSTGTSAAELRAAVTTPAGTTAAGLRVLEERAVRSALIDAVQAAADRSAELGRS